MNKEHWPFLVSSVSMVIVVMFFVGFYSNTNIKTQNHDKTEVILYKVLEREVVPDTYLRFIDDEDLVDQIIDYNRQTTDLLLGFTEHATKIIINLCEIKDEAGELLGLSAVGHKRIPTEYKIMIGDISRYALYSNATELIQSDKNISQVIATEIGGSYGVWPHHIHYDATLNPMGITSEELEAYFDLVDEIVIRMASLK